MNRVAASSAVACLSVGVLAFCAGLSCHTDVPEPGVSDGYRVAAAQTRELLEVPAASRDENWLGDMELRGRLMYEAVVRWQEEARLIDRPLIRLPHFRQHHPISGPSPFGSAPLDRAICIARVQRDFTRLDELARISASDVDTTAASIDALRASVRQRNARIRVALLGTGVLGGAVAALLAPRRKGMPAPIAAHSPSEG